MKNIFKKITHKANNALISLHCTMKSKDGEGYVDTGVKILIAVVLGALVLSLLYALLNGTVMPKVTEKVTSMFSYTA